MADQPVGGKFPLPLFILFLLFGLAIDILLSWIPGVGTVSVFIFRLILGSMGVKAKGLNWVTAGGGIVEAIPAISILPAVSSFLVVVYCLDAFAKQLPPVAQAAIEGGPTGAAAAAVVTRQKQRLERNRIQQSSETLEETVSSESSEATAPVGSAERPILQMPVKSPAPEEESKLAA